MPLDPSIALQVKPPQFDDIGTIRARGLQLRGLQRADEQAERELAEQRTIREIYQRSMGADGQIDSDALVRGVAEAGLGDRIPGIQKDALAAQGARATARKSGLDADAAQLKLTKDKIDGMNGILASVLSNQNAGVEDVTAGVNEAVNRGYMTPEQGAQTVRSIGPNARQWAMQRAIEGLDHAKRIDLLLPKYDEQDTGGELNQGTIDQITGQRTAGTNVTKTLTPGEIQSGKNAETLAGSGGSVQTDANGRMIFVPNKVPPGQAVVPRPIVDPNGNQVAGRGLNDSQSKALLFASRGQAANKILEELSAKGVNRPSVTKEVLDAVPVIGGALGAAANATVVSPEQQQVDQAQRDFINATLRRESGAAISPSEFDNARKQYFVQIGDSPEVIAQKKQNRELAMRGILAEVPEGMRNQIDAPTDQPPPVRAPPTGARPPLEAIFGKPR